MNKFLESEILPQQFNQSAQFKEYEAKCAERVFQYLSQPALFEEDQQQQNQDNLIHQLQLNTKEIIPESRHEQEYRQLTNNKVVQDSNQAIAPLGTRRVSMNSISDSNTRRSQKLEKIPTFSQRDEDLFQEDGGVEKKYQQFFHNSLQVSEDSCYQILQDHNEQDDDKDQDEDNMINGHMNEEMKNYELSSIQQNTQNSLANFNPNDDVLLTSNREINNPNELNNLMQLNLNLLFPNSQLDEDLLQRSNGSKKSDMSNQYLHYQKNNIFANTISSNQQHDEDAKQNQTLTAKELYLKAKEDNRIFLENLQKQSMRINYDDMLLNDNHFQESKQMNVQELNHFTVNDDCFEQQNQQQLNIQKAQTPELLQNDQNNGEKTCINTLITECCDQGDLVFDLNELDNSMDNGNFYDMIQQNINKVKEQTNFPNFNATFYPLDTIKFEQDPIEMKQNMTEQEDTNSSNATNQIPFSTQSQQYENHQSWNNKNTSYSSGNSNPLQQISQPQKAKKQGDKNVREHSKKNVGKQQSQLAQQIPQNNAMNLINKYYNKKNRSTSTQQQQQQQQQYQAGCNQLTYQNQQPSSLQSRKNSTFNPNNDKENAFAKHTFKNLQEYQNYNEDNLLILNEDPHVQLLTVKAEQAPLKCISSNVANVANMKDSSLIKQQITQFKNILGSKSNVTSMTAITPSTTTSAFNSRKNSNVSTVANSQNKSDRNKTNGVSLNKYQNHNSNSTSKNNISSSKQQQQLNTGKFLNLKLDSHNIDYHQGQENNQNNQQKKVTKNAAYEALQKIKNARSQVANYAKENLGNTLQARNRAQSIAGDSSKTYIATAPSVDQRLDSKLNTEATCSSSSYIQTDQGYSEYKKIGKRNLSQVCQSLEEISNYKNKEELSESDLNNPINQVRNSLNECLNPSSMQKALSNQNSRKISIYEDQYLMEAKKQEIEALQSLISSYEQEEQKFSSKLSEMNINNIVIGDKKFIQQIRRSREERKQSTSSITPAITNRTTNSFGSRSNSISLNQPLEATFSNQQSRQSHSTQPNDFNQVHRLSGSFTTKSARISAKSSTSNSFSIDSKAASTYTQNHSLNLSSVQPSQIQLSQSQQPQQQQQQQQPWFMKKAPFYVKQQQQQQQSQQLQHSQPAQHQISQDCVQNVAPSNTARSYLNKSQNEIIENKSHLVSVCEAAVNQSPKRNDELNGIIKDLISDKVYLQAVALFTSCYYYSKQGTGPNPTAPQFTAPPPSQNPHSLNDITN